MTQKMLAPNVRSHSQHRTHPPPTHEAAKESHISAHTLDTASPAEFLYLQRMIGNQALQRMVIARQEAPVADPPVTTNLLTPAQVQTALNFYRSQPSLYTKEIITQIQTEIGTEPTGKMTAVDVQAVAKRQQDINAASDTKNGEPQLKVDGMAGPRTLPSIFKFGLSEDKSVSDFTKKASDKWNANKGKSEADTAKEIVNDLINKRFEELKIPRIDDVVIGNIGSRGSFNAVEWKLNLDSAQFQPGKFHDLRETTATIYHEARHAEQDFRIGQLLARQGKDAAQINARTGLKKEIAEEARKTRNDMTPMQAVIAQGWFDSKFGAEGQARFQRNNAELRTTFAAREAACDAFKKNPSPENKAKLEKAKAKFDKTVEEHDDMPHEFDAERLEAKVRKGFGKGEDHNDPCA